MALFYVSLFLDSFSLLRFICHCDLQSFSLFYRLKYPYSVFPPFGLPSNCSVIFLLRVLFLVVVISLSLIFFFSCVSHDLILMNQCNPQSWWFLFVLLFLIHSVYQCLLKDVRPFSLLSISVYFWSISPSSSFVYFKNTSQYITRGDSPGIYSFEEISATELGFEKFSCPCEKILYLFFKIISASNILKYLQFSFSSNILMLSWFGSSLSSVVCIFPIFIVSMTHLSILKSISIS